MDDRELVELLVRREEQGADELLRCYGPMLRYIIAPILPDPREREECLNDVVMRPGIVGSMTGGGVDSGLAVRGSPEHGEEPPARRGGARRTGASGAVPRRPRPLPRPGGADAAEGAAAAAPGGH